MNTTITIDAGLMAESGHLSGIDDDSALVYAALETLIARERARRLVALGGTDASLQAPPRRRSPPGRPA